MPAIAPVVSAYGRYGIGARTDIDMGLFLPVSPVIGADLGAAHLLWPARGRRPALMVGGRLAVFGNGRSWARRTDPSTGRPVGLQPRLFEEIYLNASWDLWPRGVGYLGADLFAQAEHNAWRPSAVAGLIWRSQTPVSLQAEVAWLAFAHRSDALSLRYIGLGPHGAVALHVGLAYDFGRHPAPRARPDA